MRMIARQTEGQGQEEADKQRTLDCKYARKESFLPVFKD